MGRSARSQLEPRTSSTAFLIGPSLSLSKAETQARKFAFIRVDLRLGEVARNRLVQNLFLEVAVDVRLQQRLRIPRKIMHRQPSMVEELLEFHFGNFGHCEREEPALDGPSSQQVAGLAPQLTGA
jgi:hypothetical protein